ncbi:hypothetical protein HY379_01910 [Candidatus Saccharibacteria bacterium]|nr:hypothetical protein [Candidatus Saccharibacteria bacterium]
MLWFVAGAILLIVALLLSLLGFAKVIRAKEYGVENARAAADKKEIGVSMLIAAGAVATLGLVGVALSTTYFQDPGESKVIRGFGRGISRIDDKPGLGFKAPWQTIATFNVRNQRIEMFGGSESRNPTVGSDGAAIVAPVQGSANVTISVTVVYSIKEDKVGDVYTNYGNQANLLDTALRPNIRDVVRTESARFEPFLIKERRAELEVAVREKLKALWDPIGVRLETINWGDFRLDDATEKSLAAVNQAKANAERERNNLLKAEFEAEQTRVIAKGDSDSDQIIRCGAKTIEIVEVIAGKETKVTKVIPLPQSLCQNRLNAQVLTARWLNTLEKIGAKGNLIVVTPDGPNGINPRLDLPLNSTTNPASK